MAYPENALTLDILPLSADTARLVRVLSLIHISLDAAIAKGVTIVLASGRPTAGAVSYTHLCKAFPLSALPRWIWTAPC